MKCPRCGYGIPSEEAEGRYPGALSRWDNRTEICSQCGFEEAVNSFLASLSGVPDVVALHPLHGVRFWKHPPETFS